MSNAIAVVNKKEAVQRLMASLEDVVTIRSAWLDDKRGELSRAIDAHKALSGAGASESKVRYSRNRVAMLRKVVNILEAGFIPIPRFSAETLNVDFEEMPVKVLMAVSDAKATDLFDEIKIVRGEEAIGGQGRRRYRTQRDPLLVGIVRMPPVTVSRTNENGWVQSRTFPAREEQFLLAWWRPEEEVDSDMW